jgi:hypothetical protein
MDLSTITNAPTEGAFAGLQTQTRAPFVKDVDFSDHQDIGAAVSAHYQNETLLGAAFDQATHPRGEFTDQGFNQFAFYNANQKDFGDLDYWVRQGHFDNVTSKDEFLYRAAQIRREMERKDAIANGGALGTILGVGASFLDISSVVPVVGMASKAKAATMAANMLLQSTAQEALLHQMQETRTISESMLNIGAATVIGGGLGLFGGIFAKGHPLNPENPLNPLRLENDVPLAASLPGHGASLSAAAANETVDFAEGQGLGLLDWLGRKIKSPVALTKSLQDGEARAILNDTVSLGLRRADGRPVDPSAEDLYLIKYEGEYKTVAEKLNETYKALQGDLGQSAAGTAVRRELEAIGVTRNAVTEKEWNDALFEKLNNPSFVHANPTVEGRLGEVQGTVRSFLDRMSAEAERVGLLEPGQKIENYVPQRWRSDKIAANPDAFESALLRLYERQTKQGPTDEWLKANYGIDRKGFEALEATPKAAPSGSPALPSKKDILEDWHYEGDATKLRAAERSAEATAADLKEARVRYVAESRELRKTENALRRAELKEVQSKGRALEADLATERERLKLARDEERAFTEAASAARERTATRQTAFYDIKPAATNEVAGLERALAGKPETFKGPKEPPRTTSEAEQAARAQELGIARQKQEAKVNALEQRLERLQEHEAYLSQKADELRARRETLAQTRKATNLEARKASKDARRAAARLSAAETKLSYPDFVKETRRALLDRTQVPYGFLYDKVGDSGRTKVRAIKLDAEARAELAQRGMLETDVSQLLHTYTRDMGGRMALVEKFGSQDLEEQLARVSDNYSRLIADAQARGDTKAAKALVAEQRHAGDLITAMRDRVLGRHSMPEDPSSAVAYLGRMARWINFDRFMGGTMLSALPDIATMSLQNGMGRHLMTGFGQPIARLAKGMKDREVAAIIFGSENSLLFSRSARNMEMDELLARRGMGEGWTRAVTAGLEGGAKWAGEKMMILNGNAWWNSRNKFIAGQIQMQNILRDAKAVAAGQALQAARVTEYARFGVDMDHLKGIAAQMEKHGAPMGGEGERKLVDPNTAAWTDPDARLRLLTLLRRAVDEAVISPSMADTPAFMSSQAGRILFQFQSFGHAAINKYARSAIRPSTAA